MLNTDISNISNKGILLERQEISFLRSKVDSTPPVHFWKYTLVCQPNYMVDAPCICMAEPEAFQDELIGHIRTPYEIHVDLHMAGAGWVRGPLGRQRARPASILNMPPRAPPAGVCAAGGARRSRTSLAGPGGGPIYFIWESKRTPTVWTPPRAPNPTGSVWITTTTTSIRIAISTQNAMT